MRLQRFSEHAQMPWANGRGTSFEVARGPGDPWAWRVAIAPVIEPGPFSSLAGVDRELAVMEEAPLSVVIDGEVTLVRRGEVARFSGDAHVTCSLPKGPTRDCGLMVRRGFGSGSMSVVSGGSVGARVIVALEESVVENAGSSARLSSGDALIGEAPEQVTIRGGLVCVIEVAP